MESRQPQKNQETEDLRDAQTPRQRRFRIIKLEERIAPKKSGWGHNTKACVETAYCATAVGCDTVYCATAAGCCFGDGSYW